MTTLSGAVTLAASCLFIYVNLGPWQALVGAAVGAALVFVLHKRVKRDPEETTD
jgi:4-hydroxybenzoate polyprenyltransferase